MTAPTDHQARTGADGPWWHHLPEALRSADAAERLVRDYVDHSAAEDLAERGADDLVAAVASHVAAGLHRTPGAAVVRTVDGTASGARAQQTTVEVVSDDMPFLVDSLTASLTGSGHGIVSVAHPRLAARRADDAGEAVRVVFAAHAPTAKLSIRRVLPIVAAAIRRIVPLGASSGSSGSSVPASTSAT